MRIQIRTTHGTDTTGLRWTENFTLVRKTNVSIGVRENPVTFDPTQQWDTLPLNTFSNLGQYTNDCYFCDTVIDTIVTSICGGDSIIVGTSVYKSSGQYVDTLVSATGCDSIVKLTLTINPTHLVLQNYTFCEGDSVVVNNVTYTMTGVYFDTLQKVTGCDSVLEINVVVNSARHTLIADTVCSAEGFDFNGTNLTQTGTYFDTLASSTGCDSIVTLNLEVVKSPIVEIKASDTLIALNGTINFNPNGSNASTYWWDFGDGNFSNLIAPSHTYNDEGVFTVVLRGTLGGCDFTDTLVVEVWKWVGIEEQESTASISVFPNPAKDQINIKFNNATTTGTLPVQLFDISGALIWEDVISSMSNFNN